MVYLLRVIFVAKMCYFLPCIYIGLQTCNQGIKEYALTNVCGENLYAFMRAYRIPHTSSFLKWCAYGIRAYTPKTPVCASICIMALFLQYEAILSTLLKTRYTVKDAKYPKDIK